MSKITVKDFVEGYKKCVSDSEKEKYFDSVLEIVTYVPYEFKDAVAKNIIKTTTHTPEDEKTKEIAIEARPIHVNSSGRNMFFRLSVVKYWTNIEVDLNNALEEYNLLAEYDLYTIISKMVPQSELGEFAALTQWAMDDFMSNEMSIQAYIGEQFARFGGLTKEFIKIASGKIIDSVNNMDEKTVNTLLNGVENKILKFAQKK